MLNDVFCVCVCLVWFGLVWFIGSFCCCCCCFFGEFHSLFIDRCGMCGPFALHLHGRSSRPATTTTTTTTTTTKVTGGWAISTNQRAGTVFFLLWRCFQFLVPYFATEADWQHRRLPFFLAFCEKTKQIDTEIGFLNSWSFFRTRFFLGKTNSRKPNLRNRFWWKSATLLPFRLHRRFFSHFRKRKLQSCKNEMKSDNFSYFLNRFWRRNSRKANLRHRFSRFHFRSTLLPSFPVDFQLDFFFNKKFFGMKWFRLMNFLGQTIAAVVVVIFHFLKKSNQLQFFGEFRDDTPSGVWLPCHLVSIDSVKLGKTR